MKTPLKTPEQFAKLTADLKLGHQAALAAAAASDDDGGSCNFDAPMFYFDRMPSPQAQAKYEAAMSAAGISGYFTKRLGGAALVFGPDAGGQGFSRTRAAEAFEKALREQGYDNTSVWYEMD